MNNTTAFDSDLNPVLEISDAEDLSTLVAYLKDKLSEGLTKDEAYKYHYPDHTQYADLIAKEIREMGGNSFANIVRSEGPKYHEIVCDVAKKLKIEFNKSQSVAQIEEAILEHIFQVAIEKMDDSEKSELIKELSTEHRNLDKTGISTAAFITLFRAGGFASYKISLIIANQVARIILGHGLAFATNYTLVRAASILTGPLGWAISGIWTAVDIAGPSYKTTIPCVIHIAMLRKKINSSDAD